MALGCPSAPEANVRQTDAGPDEEIVQSRQGQEPGEDFGSDICLVDESEQAED